MLNAAIKNEETNVILKPGLLKKSVFKSHLRFPNMRTDVQGTEITPRFSKNCNNKYDEIDKNTMAEESLPMITPKKRPVTEPRHNSL